MSSRFDELSQGIAAIKFVATEAQPVNSKEINATLAGAELLPSKVYIRATWIKDEEGNHKAIRVNCL